MQVQEASEALEHAINKSHGSHTEGVVRAVAVACVYRGLQPLSNGFLMKPVAYSVVSRSLRNNCPDLTFVNDWDEKQVETDNNACDMDRYDSGGYSDYDGQYDRYGNYCDDNNSNSSSASWTLTGLLQTKQCQKHFSIVTTGTGSEPQVIAHLQSLVLGAHRRQVAWILSALHTMTVHTANPAYKTHYNDALQQQMASEASAAALVSFILPAQQLSSAGAAMWCCT